MAESIQNLEAAALRLPEKDRAELARVLLLSLGAAEPEGSEAVWAEEAERRDEELTSGAAPAIPSAQVFQEARSRLK